MTTESAAARIALIAVALLFLAFFLILPMVVVLGVAPRKGLLVYIPTFADPDAQAAIRPP